MHSRMPVLLHRDKYDQRLHGSFDDLLALQKRVFPAELIEIDRTSELCVKKKSAEPQNATQPFRLVGSIIRPAQRAGDRERAPDRSSRARTTPLRPPPVAISIQEERRFLLRLLPRHGIDNGRTS
ncbi:hypothetical protein EV184_1168 [Sinorhizobium americanum]|uniref:Uncharacterized protein n=1 Tax=Sinorhizobium americanum TaxID=194963 RepID=A0A4R2BJX6_9HYPH|nr:hypothetical protein EV184_1168 [Sinorhizobium americanum]